MLKLLESAVRISVFGLPAEIDQLVSAFRYRPNDYFHADSYQLHKMTGGEQGWDGYCYPFHKRDDNNAEILRGYRDGLLKKCAELKIKVDTRQLLPRPFAHITSKDIPDDLIKADFSLDEGQKRAVADWLAHGIGFSRMSVNSGKTAALAACAAYIKREYPEARFLYFTQTERLVRQVYASMRQFLPGWDITQYGGGKHNKDGKDMIVATIAILGRHWAKLKKSGWFNSFIGVMIDECHHSSSPTSEKILKSMAAYFRMAASDSVRADDPVRFNKILGLCGPIRNEVKQINLIEAKRSAKPLLYLVDIAGWKNKFRHLDKEPAVGSEAWTYADGKWLRGEYRGPVFERDAEGEIVMKTRQVLDAGNAKMVKEEVPVTVQGLHELEIKGQATTVEARFTILERRYDRAIIRFEPRNRLICDWTKWYSDKGWPTLVVCTRTPHVLILYTLLRKSIKPELVRFLIGEHTSRERDETFAWFKSTSGAVLISPLIREGVSINEIKAGVIADTIKNWETFNQVIGRFIRKKKDTEIAHITAFVDRQHPIYQKNAYTLFEKLEQIEGYSFLHPVEGPDSIEGAAKHDGVVEEVQPELI